ncbi:hypothetical protein [Magnetospirillum molischianum]|uniref:Uncharacterized protein n=1 Tax=Magnetospirillum molischianum DSM 120 TaxID=1150626 RepID=H8FY76_MAGML|nr:hypothetical protein [Magnetospirillum molischianum]CCG43314.1 hypothetical protein PHAMO_80105 [Magnetospirillum molischianum DSM 120]
MKLFVPPLGTRLRLTADWTFPLFNEHRNYALIKRLELIWPESTTSYDHWHRTELSQDVTLPVGTILTVDRIYIRQGQDNFDSMTFTVFDCPDMRLRSKSKGGPIAGRVRFWAKLENINGLECELFEEVA